MAIEEEKKLVCLQIDLAKCFCSLSFCFVCDNQC